MITKEVRDLWATALESGAYKQGRGALLTLEGTYCCLGVLCAELDILTDEVSGYKGLDDYGLYKGDRATFINNNDVLRKSFTEIAEMVRALPVQEETK